MAVPNLAIKMVFLLHLSLTVGASYSAWLPSIYEFYNGFLLVSLLWALHARDSEDAPFIGLGISSLSMLFDILTFVYALPLKPLSSKWFSMLCGLANLFLRPVTSYYLFRLHSERGSYSLHGRSRYEDLDRAGPRAGEPVLATGEA